MSALAKSHQTKKEIQVLTATAVSADELMSGIVGCLQERVLKFNWVGFYMLEKERYDPHGKVVGELDIDSHFPSAFGSDERELVEYCAQLMGQFLEKSGS